MSSSTRPLSSESGVTMIELLVAVTMVALLSTGMAVVLRTALNGSQKTQGHLNANRRVMGVERVMREEITNLIPVNTVCGGENKQPPFSLKVALSHSALSPAIHSQKLHAVSRAWSSIRSFPEKTDKACGSS